MFHKIAKTKTLPNNLLWAEFRDGTEVIYDIASLLETNEVFRNLISNPALFDQVQVDPGGYGISWNDDIDLDSEEIWNGGIKVKLPSDLTPGCECPTCGQKIRRHSTAQANASRANLAKRTHKGGRPINPNSKRQQRLVRKTIA